VTTSVSQSFPENAAPRAACGERSFDPTLLITGGTTHDGIHPPSTADGSVAIGASIIYGAVL